MKISIIDHALRRAEERGASEEEIMDTVKNGLSVAAKLGRMAREKVYPYNGEWLGERYPQKKVKAIYVSEGGGHTVITVYVFYGRWPED